MSVGTKPEAAITLDDIAQRAGITKAAVSEILRDHPNASRFRAETRQRVQRIANDLAYRPNFFASQIRQANRRLVLLCVDHLAAGQNAHIVSGFEAVLARAGYSLMVSPLASKSDPRFHRALLGSHGILALAVVGPDSTVHFPDEVLADYRAEGVQIVTVERECAVPGVNRVYTDLCSGAREALEHLLGQGLRSAWFCRRGHCGEPVDDCALALEDYLHEQDPRVTCRHLALPYGGDGGVLAALFGELRNGVPEALICRSEGVAGLALRALDLLGLKAGRDLAVVCCRETPLSRLLTPALATVRADPDTLGETAAEMLLAAYEGRCPPGQSRAVPSHFVLRESGYLTRA